MVRKVEKKVLDNIKEHNLINENDVVVVGVSGGPDSMALLYVLIEIRKKIKFQILVAHVNHGVRGEDALNDQLFVKRKCDELALPYYFKNVDMVSYGKEKGITAEEAGRELRYGFFRDILNKHGGGKIAVAHNKNDQAETLLLRILRGTGIDGLKGMEFLVGDIIRPILNIDRFEIEKYVEDNNIETVLDKTNLQPIYSRNKVRLELIPYIEENFNPNIINTLWRLSQVSSLDSKFLEQYSKSKYNLIVKNETKDSIILNGKLLLNEDKSIVQRVVRIAIQKVNGSLQGFTEIHISSVLDLFLLGGTGKTLDLPNNIIVKTSYEDLIIEKKNSIELGDFFYELELGENNFLQTGYSFNIRIVHRESMDSFLMESKIDNFNKKNNVKLFDYDKIKGNLYVRNRRIGDRFIPFGMKGNKKLKDYFIDEKIPKDLRDEIPIIVDDESILWIVGHRISEVYKVTKETKKILIIEYNSIT